MHGVTRCSARYFRDGGTTSTAFGRPSKKLLPPGGRLINSRLVKMFPCALCAVLAALLSATTLSPAEARRPNVLWLIAEDFGPHLACYGTREVSTPNLDRLAAEGVRFTRFFTTAPVCSPSRSAFMTGMYQTSIGAHNHRAHRDDGYELPAGVRVLTDWFREINYFTANV